MRVCVCGGFTPPVENTRGGSSDSGRGAVRACSTGSARWGRRGRRSWQVRTAHSAADWPSPLSLGLWQLMKKLRVKVGGRVLRHWRVCSNSGAEQF